MPAKKTTEDAGVKKTPVAKKTEVKKPAAPKKTLSAEAKTAAPKKPEASPKKILSKGIQKRRTVENPFSGRNYTLGVGKRKTATALVRLHDQGKGQVLINNRKIEEYFFGILVENALQPLTLTGKEKAYDVTIKLVGGGVAAQADAVRHGIARALVRENEDLRIILKKAGYLTRDSRKKERKKPGLKRARRAPQWVKR